MFELIRFVRQTPEWRPATAGVVQRKRDVKKACSSYFFFPPSSAIYMISCLKMKRFGPLSRVSRTMFRS